MKVSHLFVDSSIATGLRNSYLLTAHGRLVGDPASIERKYALKDLPDGKAYVAVVSSDFLDERVDQERLDFKLTAQQRDALQEAILAATESFLHAHIPRCAPGRRRRSKVSSPSTHMRLLHFASVTADVAGNRSLAKNEIISLYNSYMRSWDRTAAA